MRPAQVRSKDPSAGPKHHGTEGRIGPAAGSPRCQTLPSELPGHGRECLTLLSEPTTKPSCLTQNGACATAKQQGPERRTGPASHGREYLTWLSEPTRKPSCLTQNGACATAKQQGPEGRTGACGNCFLLLASSFLFSCFLPLLLVITSWPLLLVIPPLTRSPCCKRGRRISDSIRCVEVGSFLVFFAQIGW